MPIFDGVDLVVILTLAFGIQKLYFYYDAF